MTRLRVDTPRGAALVLLLVAIATRAWDFGNPIIHVDEQYYLLVGDRLLHGAIPYVDIWDRKPIGLFLIYAAIRLLPGDGVLAYQLVATLVAWATACIVSAATLRIGATRRAALAAGALYLVWITLLGGRGGQSPVFYNALVAAAALLTLRAPRLAGRALLANGIFACGLAGLAIQVKWTPAFEGAFFGLAHLWFARRSGTRPAALLAMAAAWLVAGALPTLLAVGWYWRLGAFDAYWFANITSIFLRPGYPADQLVMRLLGITAICSPLIAATALGWRSRASAEQWLAFGWLCAALVGFLAIGTFFDHYALPLVAPLVVTGAPSFGRRPRALVGALGIGALIFFVQHVSGRSDARGARAVAALVRANSAGGCPYVFMGDTITYRLADACLPTAYAFPNFLAYTTEQGATGIDEPAEVARILATRPPVIIASTRKLDIWNQASIAHLRTVLGAEYRLVLSEPRSNYRTLVFLRRDLPLRK